MGCCDEEDEAGLRHLLSTAQGITADPLISEWELFPIAIQAPSHYVLSLLLCLLASSERSSASRCRLEIVCI